MIDCMAYREIVLRALMNDAMGQNFVQLATGGSLDMWGELFGAERKESESDDDFRERIMLANKVNIGTSDAYKTRILGVNDIIDAKVLTQITDDSIIPGDIVVTALQTKGNGGGVPDNNHESHLMATINTPSFAILGAKVTYKLPIAVPINGALTIKPIIGQSADAETKAKEITENYIIELSKSFDANFEALTLEQKLLNVDSIHSVTYMDFNVEPLKGVQYYTLGTITISV